MKPGRGDLQVIDRRLNRFARKDPAYRTATKTVLVAQRALRRMLTELEWQVYVVINERTNALHGVVMNEAIRAAFKQGRRSVRTGDAT